MAWLAGGICLAGDGPALLRAPRQAQRIDVVDDAPATVASDTTNKRTTTTKSATGDSKLKWRPVRQVAHDEEPVEATSRSRFASPQRLSARETTGATRLVNQAQVRSDDPFFQPRPTSPMNVPTIAPPAGATPDFGADPTAEPAAPTRPAPMVDPFDTAPAPMRTPRPTNLEPGEVDVPSSRATESADSSCQDSAEDCRLANARLRKDTITAVNVDILIQGKPGRDFPCECVLEGGEFKPRNWAMVTYTWKASALCHKPLYFEQVQMERYGHSSGWLLDPVVSAAHFFLTLPILPYKMGVDPPNECIYSLGYIRPGNCAPYVIEPFPLSLRGALFEGAAIGGLVYALP